MLLALRSLWAAVSGDVTVNLIGVAAAAAIGTASIDVSIPITGVAASPSIGAGAFTAEISGSGVAASPAVGTATFNVDSPITGVFGSAAIGVGAFDADFAISGVVAGAAVGSTQIDVTWLLAGVAASPAIGTGTVLTGADEIVYLIGVAADPLIGTGTDEIASGVHYPRPYADEILRPIPKVQKFRDKHPKIPKLLSVVYATSLGIDANANVGRITVDATVSAQAIYQTNIVEPLIEPVYVFAKSGETPKQIELTDEEILTLMEAA